MSLIELRGAMPAVAPDVPRAAGGAAVEGRRAGGRGDTPWRVLALIALLAAAGLAAAVGAVVVNGDAVWHLVWGRELLDGTLESFSPGPTPHPSLLALGALTSLLGDDGSYLVTYALFGPLSFGALVAVAFEIARRLSSPVAAVIAAVLVATSVGVVSLTAAARYDLAFAALMLAAVALEIAKPRRAVAPLACLAAAGLIRPEAWILGGIYWLWLAPRLTWPARVRLAALAAAAPTLWMTMDLLVTGDPLYSLHFTDSASEALYGQYTRWENLETAGRNLVWYLGVIPLAMLLPAAALLLRDRPRPALPLLAALAVTLAIFLLFLAQGVASNERYLLVPVCAIAILAAIAVDGGGRRTPRRMAVGAVLAVAVGLQLAANADDYRAVASGSSLSHRWYESVRALVRVPGVGEALRDCPSVSLAGQRPWLALQSGRPPGDLIIDTKARTRPDIYVAPGNDAVAKAVLTRARFDDDATFRVPPGMTPGPRNADWILYVNPSSRCAAGLG